MAKLIILVLIGVLLISYVIVNSYSLNLKEKQDQKQFFSIFSKWVYKVFKNTGNIVGYTIKQDWSPINKTGDKNDTKTTE